MAHLSLEAKEAIVTKALSRGDTPLEADSQRIWCGLYNPAVLAPFKARGSSS